jgi:hypothetical protein
MSDDGSDRSKKREAQMPDDNDANQNTPTAEVSQTEHVDKGERSYTQAEVDALMKQTKDSTFAEARRTLKGSKRQDEAKPEKAAANDKGEDRESRREAQHDAINDAVIDYGLSKEQRNTLRDLIRIANPADPDAWVKSTVDAFRPRAESQTDKPTAQTKELPVAQRQPGDHPGPAQTSPPWERPTDPFKWSHEEVARMEAQLGRRQAHRLIRQKAEAFARTMRIQMTPQRR